MSCLYTALLPDSVQAALAEYHRVDVPVEKRKLPAGLTSLPKVLTLCGEDYKTEDDVFKVINEKYPFTSVLFKDFLNADQVSYALNKFKEETWGKEYRVMNYSHLEDKMAYGGLFQYGIDPDFVSPTSLTPIDGIWNGTLKNAYGSFVPISSENKLHRIFNFTSNSVVRDTSFFSWNTRKAVTTAIHANWPADTIAIQLAGRKQWVLMDSFEIKQTHKEQGLQWFAGYTGGVLYPSLHIDENFVSRLQIVTANPGDMLFFPPYGAHVVVTDPGLNVMTALRYENVMKGLKVDFKNQIQAALGYLFMNRFHTGGNQKFHHEMFRQVQTGGSSDETLEALFESPSLSTHSCKEGDQQPAAECLKDPLAAQCSQAGYA